MYIKEYVYDIECDGLLEDCTKIHCLSVGYVNKEGKLKIISTTDYLEMKKFFERDDIFRIAHNGKLYDERVIYKILGVKPNNNIIDSLVLSWYLYPDRSKHGLESWGEDFRIKKPEIKDWKNLSQQEYIHRCEEDVKINYNLWIKEKSDLYELYNSEDECKRFINYLMFKLDCVEEQENNPVKINIEKVRNLLFQLEKEKEDKISLIQKSMPKVPKIVTRNKPKVLFRKDGQLTVAGANWMKLLLEYNLPEDYSNPISVVKNYEEPNPSSIDQIKKWLFSLGWEPENIAIKKDKVTGKISKIPQISSKNKDGSICESIKKLYNKEPVLEHLDGLSILGHRIGLLKGFLDSQENGYIKASLLGLTNTLRLKHKGIVNLPGLDKKYGYDIRSCIISEDSDILCGSDMSALEDTTKQHYMYFHDPEYVKEMRTAGFDPHTNIAVMSGIMTEEEEKFYKWFQNKK